MLITARRSWLGPGRIRHGWAVRVEDDRIAQVGPLRRLLQDGGPQEQVVDYGDACLLPGLVNAHCHLEQGHLRERIPSSGGFPWWYRRLLGAHHDRLGEELVLERIAGAIRLGAGELLSHGTTAVCDVSSTGMPAGILAGFPLRAVCALECSSLAGTWEGAGRDRALRYLEGPRTALLRRTVVPHSLHACTARLLADLSQEGFHRGTPSLHLAQSLEERELLDQGMGPMRALMDTLFPGQDISPVEGTWGRLAAFYPPRRGMLAIHGGALQAREIRRLAKAGASLVLCPQDAEHLGSPLPDFDEIARQRLGVALGTESLASCHALSLWREMAVLKGLHPGLDPGAILSWATAGGARALGIGSGTLEAGRLADWVAADCADVPDGELEAHLVGQEPDVVGTGVGGTLVF